MRSHRTGEKPQSVAERAGSRFRNPVSLNEADFSSKGKGQRLKGPLSFYIRKMEQSQKHRLGADTENALCICSVSPIPHTHNCLGEVSIAFFP